MTEYGAQPARSRWRGLAVALGVLVAGVAGLAAGIIWHEPIAHALRLHKDAAEVPAGGAKQLWTCGMHPQVIQDKPGTCPICHMKLTPLKTDAAASQPGGGERKIKYWWDPMLGPGSISDKPGKSAMGMDLVPVYEDEVSGGVAVTIDPVVVQNTAMRVTKVTRGPLERTLRAVGYLEEAQPLVHDVNLRVSGWIEKLDADTEGQHLKKGDPLFELYSPEVQVAVEELIVAGKAVDSLGPQADALGRGNAQALAGSVRRKLGQWGLDENQIEKLAKLDRAPRTVTFNSPISGHVTQKNVVEGAAVKAGDRVLRLVNHETLWLDAQVYEQDLPFIKMGQKVQATVESMPGKTYEGDVIFIHPHVDPVTRTATVRVALPNPDIALRPGMYATARISAKLADDAVLVPREAVIDTGTRQVVFVSAGNGRFEPRKIEMGVEAGDGMVQVLKGLASGEPVVISGQFLLDAESRMKEAIQKQLDQNLLARGDQNKVRTTAPMSDEMDANPSAPVKATAPADASVADSEQLPRSADVDKVYAEYLALSKALGAPKQPDAPLDMSKLINATKTLTESSAGPEEKLPRSVLEAATAMRGKPLADQRKLFKDLSGALIAMAEVRPPSKALGKELYVAYCPMAFGTGASWVQADKAIANPYFATEMKQCGEIKRTIETAKDSPAKPK